MVLSCERDMTKELFLSCLWLLLSLPSAIVHAQSNGELRLVQRSTTSRLFTAGRLEIFIDGQWGTICDDSFDLDDANVACRQLGWTGATDVDQSIFTSFGSVGGPIWLDEVECLSEDDLHILSCSHNDIGDHDCSHFEDVAIYCTFTPIYNNPSELDVRFQDGSFVSRGRVEVYCNGEWGTICAEGDFGQNEADTACRQLGYTHAADYSHSSLPGDARQPIWLRSFECGSSNTSVRQCSDVSCPNALAYDYYGTRDCDHSDDVTIECDYDPDRQVTEGSAGITGTTITIIAAASGGGLLIILSICCAVVCCYFWKKKKTTPTTTAAVRPGFSVPPNTTVVNLQQQQPPHVSYQMPASHAPSQQFPPQFQPALALHPQSNPTAGSATPMNQQQLPAAGAAPPPPLPHQGPPYPFVPQAYLMEPTPLGDRYTDEAPPSYELAVAGYGLPGSMLGHSQPPHPHQATSNM